ncbi:N-acetylmuramidase domain-containing protein [Candidatus Pantoea formicae]|uniref:N-acetylmuramidase domain-containing protein n=1 Tax=Candidatus Pantoea formicae TaxID=2608355 RepID=UPI003EDA76F9
MSTIKISQGVGIRQPNKHRDVQTVQLLLNANKDITSSSDELKVDGYIGEKTIAKIKIFQEKVVKLSNPDGIISPHGPTLRRLHGNIVPTKNVNISLDTTASQVTDEMYVSMAKALNCEPAAIKAVVMSETKQSPFDASGRPTILYERHYFSKLTDQKYDKSHPDISGKPYEHYGKFSEQYDKLNKAIALDRSAALQSASWGAFQIMGSNYSTSGYANIEAFVQGMNTISGQVYAFVNHVSHTPTLLNAIRTKNWASFARYYNGKDYKKNNYDVKLSRNYDYALHQ